MLLLAVLVTVPAQGGVVRSNVSLHTLLLDSLAVVNPADSVAVSSADTIPQKKKNDADAVEDPVYYESSDSMVWSRTGNAYLYGDCSVKYQKIQLDAAVISMNMDSSVVRAHGVTDSTGVATGIPVFRDGDTPYESDKISYNFKSKRGYINNVFTAQGDGFMMGEAAKKDSTGAFYAHNGKYTTCDAEHPHFYIALTRAKVRPKKDVVFGPAYLVIEDVPLPLAIPFGFFPFTSSYSSGFIMPTYGDDTERGFYLSDGGYYFAISTRWTLNSQVKSLQKVRGVLVLHQPMPKDIVTRVMSISTIS